MGKRAYASPEQYWGHAVYADFTSDLYSLGLIAFEIVSGINPLAYYIAKNPAHPHEDIIHKFDRELEDIFFKHIDESETNQQLFIIIRKLLQPDKAYDKSEHFRQIFYIDYLLSGTRYSLKNIQSLFTDAHRTSHVIVLSLFRLFPIFQNPTDCYNDKSPFYAVLMFAFIYSPLSHLT